MKPELQSVRSVAADGTSTTVEIIYKTGAEMDGVELHGIGAGLSWLKGESIYLEKINYTIYIANYKTNIVLTGECEFRGRVFDEKEDYWEGTTHKLKRLIDGSISLETTDEIKNSIKYSPKPPREYVPELYKIQLIEVNPSSSVCEISYRSSEKIEGIELHGVDGGLSWLKGQSIMAQKDQEDDMEVLKVSLEVENIIEFKARAFREGTDFWEEGGNHKIERMADGSIAFHQNLDDESLINIINRLPIVFDLTLEDALTVLNSESDVPTQFLQYLVCVKMWYDRYIQDPFNQDMFDLISGMTRYIREHSRKQRSQKIDELVLPIIKSLYKMYTEAISFMEEDGTDLISEWRSSRSLEIFETLIDRIKQMEIDGFGDSKDRKDRERTLSAFN